MGTPYATLVPEPPARVRRGTQGAAPRPIANQGFVETLRRGTPTPVCYRPACPGDPVASEQAGCALPIENTVVTGWPACAGHDTPRYAATPPWRSRPSAARNRS